MEYYKFFQRRRDKSYFDTTHEVGSLEANSLGLYDMLNNVGEWCWDWDGAIPIGNVTNPTGSDTGTNRMVRGDESVSVRGYYSIPQTVGPQFDSPNDGYQSIGFRICRSL